MAGNGKKPVLVVVQLSGGNDFMNTVIPYTNSTYYDTRKLVSIPQEEVLPFTDDLAFHPKFAPIKEMYEQGDVAIVQGIGYPNSNRSHFRGMDIWHTCEPDRVSTEGWLGKTIAELDPSRIESFEELLIAAELRSGLEEFTPLAQRVIDQSARRVLHGEQVPAEEKIVSIFEPHSDIIVKGQREVVYGHKIFLTGGTSNLILDCVVEKGNPADSEQFMPALERHLERFGKAPNDVATDGGFASKANGEDARALGVQNVAFSTLKGNTLSELVQSTRIYKQLRKWRAGIEGLISAIKRAFGLDRCTWRGYESFQAYVHLSVLAFNLQTLARHLL